MLKRLMVLVSLVATASFSFALESDDALGCFIKCKEEGVSSASCERICN